MNKLLLHNRFDIEVIDAKTGKVKQKARAYNTICNQLWTRLLNSTNFKEGYAKYIHYGSGTGTPSPGDTQLFHFIAAIQVNINNISYVSDHVNRYVSSRKMIQLAPEVAVGQTITEVGCAYGNAAGNLTTHAMLQDMNGNPISILKTDTDIINIYATIYLHYNKISGFFLHNDSDDNGGFQYSFCRNLLGDGPVSAPASYVVAPLFSSASGGVNSYIPGKSYFQKFVDTSNLVFDLSNKKMTIPVPRLAVADGNDYMTGSYNNLNTHTGIKGGIPLIEFVNRNNWTQDSYYPFCFIKTGNSLIPPSEITSEAVGTGDGTTTKFGTEFDYPYEAVVSVNGTPMTSGVHVNKAIGKSGLNYSATCVIRVDGHSTLSDMIYVPAELEKSYTATYIALPAGIYEHFNCGDNDSNPILKFQKGSASYNVVIYGSNNLTDWNEITTPFNTNLTFEESHYRFYKIESSNSGNVVNFYFNPVTHKNIIFDTPPADGDVITISYKTDNIAKNADYVYDLSLIFQFGEYTPPNE